MGRIAIICSITLSLVVFGMSATTTPVAPVVPFGIAVSSIPATTPASPFECDHWSIPGNSLDDATLITLRKHGAVLRPSCSDAVFIRRVFLDAIGTLPTLGEVDAFMSDQRPEKRSVLVETLLARDEYADYWAMHWCDILRVKSEYPINLWPNAAQAYHRWIRTAMKENLPLDQFAHALLTSSGSNFLNPPVNFFRAVQARTPAALASAVALTFMGVRMEKWPQDRRDNLTSFFSRVAYKNTDEWKEEIVFLDPTPTEAIKTVFPFGAPVTVAADADPRQVFAEWLLAPTNPWFSRNIANRLWGWTMGHGVIDPPDDIRTDNPPASPELLACLQRELVSSHFDQRQLFRLIFNSRTYQQSSLAHGDTADNALQFAHYTIRRQDAEVLIDALCWIGGDGESYVSETPEPFTFIPKKHRTIALADGSITSAFLITFGRPARDTGLLSERDTHPSDTQRLYLLNSADVQRRISTSKLILRIVASARGKRSEIVRGVYTLILSRYPTTAEAAVADKYLQSGGLNSYQGANDLAWSLINSKEFLYRH